MGTPSNGEHVLAQCKDCGAMSTPVNGEWYACHCGCTVLVFPHVVIRDEMWKLTPSDRRMITALCIADDGFE